MSNKQNEKKKEQLGVAPGTARNRLVKSMMFDFAKRLDMLKCHQCGEHIEIESDLTIEHVIPWLDSEDPKGLYYALENIAFSHATCNYKAARRPNKGDRKHPSSQAYKRGCRCDECKDVEKVRRRSQRVRGIKT